MRRVRAVVLQSVVFAVAASSGTLKIRKMALHLVGRDGGSCSKVVEHKPCYREVVGLNPSLPILLVVHS